MPEPRVLVGKSKERRPLAPDPGQAWTWVGWLGLALTVVGLGDFALTWYPPGFGTPEWEFGTVAASFSGLPLVTMGLVALLAAAFTRGSRWMLWLLGVFLMLFGVALIAALLVFLTVVPVALQAAEGAVVLGIKKAVAKTVLLGAVFPVVYLVGAVAVFRHLRRQGRSA